MKLHDINISEALENARQALTEEKSLSPSFKVLVELLITIITLLLQKLNINSSNSSTPPSADPNRGKKGRVKPYEFLLFNDNGVAQALEDNKLYVCIENNQIIYQCVNPQGDIVQGYISQQDLPTDIQIPAENTLENLNKLRKQIIEITQARGDTKPLKKPGGQPGRTGVTLKPFAEPDEVINLAIDLRTLPKGIDYQEQGYTARQVVDIMISRHVTEYRAQTLIDSLGNQYIAEFPPGVGRDVQYGATIKSRVVFASVYQLIPYQRIQDQFAGDYQIPISAGSIANFITEGANLLRNQGVEQKIKSQLINSAIVHADETTVNIDGKNHWLHVASNESWIWLEPHSARGLEAMKAIGILPNFTGTLCHDHWKSYFNFNCIHALCNAHHLRELTWSFEEDKQQWAKKMHDFLCAINKELVTSSYDNLSLEEYSARCQEYRAIIAAGELECPEVPPKPGTKRKPKQSKSRNLLSRLKNHEDDVLRFIKEPYVPFTNNLGERDIRMTKVRQKISGCFKNMQRTKDFFLLRSYIQTCSKNNINATTALELLFNNKVPDFIKNVD